MIDYMLHYHAQNYPEGMHPPTREHHLKANGRHKCPHPVHTFSAKTTYGSN